MSELSSELHASTLLTSPSALLQAMTTGTEKDRCVYIDSLLGLLSSYDSINLANTKLIIWLEEKLREILDNATPQGNGDLGSSLKSQILACHPAAEEATQKVLASQNARIAAQSLQLLDLERKNEILRENTVSCEGERDALQASKAIVELRLKKMTSELETITAGFVGQLEVHRVASENVSGYLWVFDGDMDFDTHACAIPPPSLFF